MTYHSVIEEVFFLFCLIICEVKVEGLNSTIHVQHLSNIKIYLEIVIVAPQQGNAGEREDRLIIKTNQSTVDSYFNLAESEDILY
jgi:hypothetical protein